MSSHLKKISLAELEVGMFVVDMDISWLQSPFLFHRRAINTRNEVLLLKKAGVKEVTIDLNKSSQKKEANQDSQYSQDDEVSQKTTKTLDCEELISEINHLDASADKIAHTDLSTELNQANIIKKQACTAFSDINDKIKNKQAIDVETIEPIVDDMIDSLLRNDQALLTLMHLKRYEEKLFNHSFSVMTLATTFAIQNNIPNNEIKTLALAALLHDIGWAQLPLNLFGTGKKYTVNEYKVVQQHQKLAEVIVNKSENFPESIKSIMLKHHERLDGSGYPNSLLESQIDKLSKILIMCDYYDECVHGLLDSPGSIPSETLRLIYKEALSQKFEKSQVEQLIKLLGIYPLTSAVELNTGERGLVVEVNRQKPLFPVVKIMYSVDGNPLAKPYLLDLVKDDKKRQVKDIVNLQEQGVDPKQLLVAEEVSL